MYGDVEGRRKSLCTCFSEGEGLWRRRAHGLEAWMVIPVQVLSGILACRSVGWKLAQWGVCYVWVGLILSHLSLYLVLSYKTLS